MALTDGQLAEALRIDAAAVDGALTRLREGVTALVAERAPDAPDPIKDLAVQRMAAYIYDQPEATRGQGFGNAWQNSGAASLCARWIARRALAVDDA